jgi:(2Fe-2S) ferredoxin
MCERGPNMVVYPDGVWYSGVQVGDLPEIIREHFLAGRPVMRLVNADPVALKAEILENKRKAIAAMKARVAAQQGK